MKPIRTENTTSVLGKLSDWDEHMRGPCGGLPICRTADGEMFSWWRPSFRERLALLFGGNVRLCVVGGLHPPVALQILGVGVL